MSPHRECSARRPARDVGGVQHHPARRRWFHEGLTMTTDPPARAASRATCSARNFERLYWPIMSASANRDTDAGDASRTDDAADAGDAAADRGLDQDTPMKDSSDIPTIISAQNP